LQFNKLVSESLIMDIEESVKRNRRFDAVRIGLKGESSRCQLEQTTNAYIFGDSMST